MRKLFFILLLVLPFVLNAQDNKSRAEALIAIAVGKEAEGGTMEEVSGIFNAAAELAPDYAELYNAWGALIMQRAIAKKDSLLCKSSFEKFQKATELKPEYAEAYAIWGLAMSYSMDKKEKESQFGDILDKFEKATAVKPDYTEAYIYWGMTLLEQARDNDKPELYKESAGKYEKVLSLGLKEADIFEGKAWSYFRLGRLEKDYPKYKTQIVESYSEAEKLGSQSAAYNLACYFSLVKEKDLAVKWLEKTIIMNYPVKMTDLSKDRINKDEDFDNIRKDKRYKEILKKYFPKQ